MVSFCKPIFSDRMKIYLPIVSSCTLAGETQVGWFSTCMFNAERCCSTQNSSSHHFLPTSSTSLFSGPTLIFTHFSQFFLFSDHNRQRKKMKNILQKWLAKRFSTHFSKTIFKTPGLMSWTSFVISSQWPMRSTKPISRRVSISNQSQSWRPFYIWCISRSMPPLAWLRVSSSLKMTKQISCTKSYPARISQNQ